MDRVESCVQWVKERVGRRGHGVHGNNEHVNVSERVYKTGDLVRDLFGKDRTTLTIRCDRHEVSLVLKVRDTKTKKIPASHYKLVLDVVQHALDAWVAESRPVGRHSHFKFETTWERVERASDTARLRRGRLGVLYTILWYLGTLGIGGATVELLRLAFVWLIRPACALVW